MILQLIQRLNGSIAIGTCLIAQQPETFRCKTVNHRLQSTDSQHSLPFYITSCAHAICEKCMEKTNSDLGAVSLCCPKCQVIGPVVELLGPDVPADVERLFTPCIYHLEDIVKIFQVRVAFVLGIHAQYQYGNAVQLLKHLKNTAAYNRRRCLDLEEQLRSTQAYVFTINNALVDN